MKTNTKNQVSGISVYDMITDRIMEQLSKGIIPWHQPWVGGSALAISYRSRKPYSMLNQLLLNKPGEWLTWNDIQALGGKVKKGTHSSFCVWTKTAMVKTEPEANAEDQEAHLEERRYLKWYKVFHIDDTEGIQSKIEPVEPRTDLEPIQAAEQVIAGYLQRETHLRFQNDKESGEAYYSPSRDEVVVPMLSQYKVPEEYYSTTFHELTHSTMHPDRCDRKAENKLAAFGNADYSREELVAEMGAAMLCNRAGIEIDKVFKNSVAYIQSWLKVLKNDNRMITWAAARAEKAAKYILNKA